jgi:cytochrome c
MAEFGPEKGLSSFVPTINVCGKEFAMKRSVFRVAFGMLFFFAVAWPVSAQDICTEDAVVQAVEQAVQILENEGQAGLEKVEQIRFCGDNYVFVNDLKGKTLMHIQPTLIGKVLIALKDDTGKRFFADFTEVAKSAESTKGDKSYYSGKGWVDYRWPKPGQKEFSPKRSYIRGCLMGDENVYIGAGIYTD